MIEMPKSVPHFRSIFVIFQQPLPRIPLDISRRFHVKWGLMIQHRGHCEDKPMLFRCVQTVRTLAH